MPTTQVINPICHSVMQVLKPNIIFIIGNNLHALILIEARKVRIFHVMMEKNLSKLGGVAFHEKLLVPLVRSDLHEWGYVWNKPE